MKDESGNPVDVEVWNWVHTGTSRFVEGDVAYEYAPTPADPDEHIAPLPGPRTYRALTYKRVEHTSQVRRLETDGTYSDRVTVD